VYASTLRPVPCVQLLPFLLQTVLLSTTAGQTSFCSEHLRCAGTAPLSVMPPAVLQVLFAIKWQGDWCLC
jgi:hypothetical protein